ncbi:MAG: Hsp20/alpha crystallin family protein [Gammaproteobacteria bacterium]|nr:Hsp20/alpha crystallin family protein [Gammaproteobacteria bacterium]
MSTLEHLSHNIRETFDQLSEGWQHLWNKARNAVTRFTPFSGEKPSDYPIDGQTSRWGVLSAELRETDDSLEVQLEAPGMDAADFDISVRGQSLIISGKKHFESERKEGHYHISERAYGRFERVIPLPSSVNDDNARASYKKGVLSITLPKTETRKLHSIRVE